MMTIDALYKHFVEQLKIIYDEREANNIADWVFESIASIKRIDRVSVKQKQLNNAEVEQLGDALEKLLAHIPVQYILGEAWFYKMKLKVNEHVLIPRPETEELVEWIVQEFKIQNSKFKILDIGTGSGCIAIALKKEFPAAEIFAIDVSKDALQVAKENADDQKAQMNFSQIDFLNEESWKQLLSFDFIVSNPPYIPENEKKNLAKNVVDHEPHIALFVKDIDPFIFYKKIASFADTYLNEKGKVFVEVHEDYATEVQKIFADKNFKTEMKRDIFERDRMICAYK